MSNTLQNTEGVQGSEHTMPASAEDLGSWGGRAVGAVWGRKGGNWPWRTARVGEIGTAETKQTWGARIEPSAKRKQEVSVFGGAKTM